MKYSIIVPVFNRPDEVDELLESLSNQTQKDFEVIIVEDGSVREQRAWTKPQLRSRASRGRVSADT